MKNYLLITESICGHSGFCGNWKLITEEEKKMRHREKITKPVFIFLTVVFSKHTIKATTPETLIFWSQFFKVTCS